MFWAALAKAAANFGKSAGNAMIGRNARSGADTSGKPAQQGLLDALPGILSSSAPPPENAPASFSYAPSQAPVAEPVPMGPGAAEQARKRRLGLLPDIQSL